MRAGITRVVLPILLACCVHAQDRGLVQIPESRRLALVIGNSEYPQAPLKNPVNDASAMEATLKKLGFEVTTIKNADLRRMRTAIDEFAAGLGPGSLGFFYFAGHGVQVNSVNYLVPVDFSATSEDDIPYEAYPANRVQAKLEGSGARLRVLVLDACRNNPFRYKRDAGGGLAAMSINAEGTLISFATGDNNVAEENPAETNGLYTKFLIPALLTPGLNLRDAFQKAKEDVYRVSQRRQNPSIYENIVGEFALLPSVVPQTAAPQAASRLDAWAEAWALVKDSKNPEDFDNFIRAFPLSELARAAEIRASQLRRGTAAPSPAAPVGVQPPQPAPGTTKVNSKDGLIYSWIPPGTFMMGCSANDVLCKPEEKPPHRVTLSKGFWLGQTPVTDAAFKAFVRGQNNGNDFEPIVNFFQKTFGTPSDPMAPAVGMKWDDARMFCQWAGGRLPSEAEWEYAARAGTTASRYGKIDAISISSLPNGKSADLSGPPKVAQKEPNAWSLYDMLGTVWQWTGDWYAKDYYQHSEDRDPQGAPDGNSRAIRGGTWKDSSEANVRVSRRNSRYPYTVSSDDGVRCVLE